MKKNKTGTATVSKSQIRSMLHKARNEGDDAMCFVCNDALAGDEDALENVRVAIEYAKISNNTHQDANDR